MYHHKYSISEIEDMLPWEREIYISLLADQIKKENQERNSKQNHL